MSDSANVFGAMSDLLIVLNCSLANAGTYTCAVSEVPGGCETITEPAALVIDSGCGAPQLGCNRSDIAPPGAPDCVVNLNDLGVVLSYFAPGVTGRTRDQGDTYPVDVRDGIVDLRDLGQMLSDFGTDCR